MEPSLIRIWQRRHCSRLTSVRRSIHAGSVPHSPHKRTLRQLLPPSNLIAFPGLGVRSVNGYSRRWRIARGVDGASWSVPSTCGRLQQPSSTPRADALRYGVALTSNPTSRLAIIGAALACSNAPPQAPTQPCTLSLSGGATATISVNCSILTTSDPEFVSTVMLLCDRSDASAAWLLDARFGLPGALPNASVAYSTTTAVGAIVWASSSAEAFHNCWDSGAGTYCGNAGSSPGWFTLTLIPTASGAAYNGGPTVAGAYHGTLDAILLAPTTTVSPATLSFSF